MRRLSPPRGFGKLKKGDKTNGQGGTAQSSPDSTECREDETRHPVAGISPSVGSGEDSEQYSGAFSPVQPDSNRDSLSSSDGQVSYLSGAGSREGTGNVCTEGVLDGDCSDFQPGSQSYSERDSETGFVADCSDKLKIVSGLSTSHYKELKGSAISDEIAELNFSSHDDLSGEVVLSDAPRTNTGRVASHILKKLNHYEHGGWMVRGIDPETGETMDWGQVKLDRPRWDSSKGKPIKYEAPAGMATRLYFLRIPFKIWQTIAKRFKVAMPDVEADDPQLSWKFWKWVKQYPEIPILLTEGAKKAAALLSTGYCAIAAPGIWNFCPNKQIHSDLLPFVCDSRSFYLAYDQDAKATTRGAVAAAIKRLARLFKGCDTKVMEWNPSYGKGIDDVIARFNADKLHKIFREAILFEAWEIQTLKGLTREPDLYIDNDERYLKFDAPLNAALIALKAPKGTGKSEWFARYVKPIVESGTRPVVCLAHRIKLMMQLAKRIGIKYVEDCSPEEMYLKGMALCVDSFRPGGRAQIIPEQFRNAIVFIDEICQVVFHLLNSSTCGDKRVEIMQCFKDLLQIIAQFDGQVIIADADLNDAVLHLIEELMGEKAYLVVKEYKGDNTFDVINYPQSKPNELLAQFYSSVEQGKKCLMVTDSQDESSPTSSSNIEFKLKRDGISCLRVDGATSNDPTHPASQAIHTPEILKNYQVTIATSVIETGVSIDFEHFDEVYCVANGVISCDSVRQFLSRYRIPCPRFVWTSKQGLNFIGNRGTTPKQLYSAEKQKDKAIIGQLSQLGYDDIEGEVVDNVWLNSWAKLAAIHNSGNYRYREQILEDLILEGHRVWHQEDWTKGQEVYKEVSGNIEQPDNEDILNTLNNYQDIVDYIPEEKADELNSRIREQLSQSAEQAKVVKIEAKTIKEENLSKKSFDIFNAEDIPDNEYEEKKRQTAKTEAEQNAIAKKTIGNKYGKDNISPELYIRDKTDKHFYSGLKLHYHFSVGREFLNEKLGHRWENILSDKRFIPDSNKSMSHLLKVKMLDKLRIDELLQLDEMHNNHPLIVSIFESIGFMKSGDKWKIGNWNSINNIKNYLGLDLSKAQSPIDAIKRIVAMLGLKMPLLKRSGSGKIRERIYGCPIAGWEKDDKGKPVIVDGRAVEICDGREGIFACWLERDSEAKEKRASAKREQQEKEAAAAAHAERIKAEIQGNGEDAIDASVKIPQQAEKSEKDPPETETPGYYLKWAYQLDSDNYIRQGIVKLGIEKIVVAGVEWAGECVEKLKWLMNNPLLSAAF